VLSEGATRGRLSRCGRTAVRTVGRRRRSLSLTTALLVSIAGAAQAQATRSASVQLSGALALLDRHRAETGRGESDEGATITRVPDVSRTAWLREATFWRNFAVRVRRIPTNGLSVEEQLTRRTLLWESRLQSEKGAFWWVDFSSITPYASPLGSTARAISALPIREAADTTQLLRILRTVPAFVDSIRAGLEQRAARNIRLSRDALPATVALVRAYAVPGERNPFAIRAAQVRALDSATQRQLLAEGSRIVDRGVVPAVERLLSLLEGDYATRAPAGVGLSQYPGGAAYYRWLVRWHTTIDVSSDSVHAIGVANVTRIEREMAEIQARVGGAGPATTFRAALGRDPRFFAKTPDEFGARLMEYAARLEPKLDAFFARRPRAKGDVRRLPPELEPAMTFGYYQVPTATDSIGHYFYNGTALQERSLLTAGPLIAHELWPGHHFQVALAKEQTGLPPYRRTAYYTAYGEGWGDYAAIVAGEMGLYADPYDRYGRLAMDMFISCRLVVDTGMNALGWTRERAMAYMREHLIESETQIRSESLRYSTDLPGQALAYKMGSLEFERLRARAEASLGTRFDVRHFHEQVMNSGMLPMSVLGEKIDAWLRTSR
jgi:uncharacterized protein (DUF885 family)